MEAGRAHFTICKKLLFQKSLEDRVGNVKVFEDLQRFPYLFSKYYFLHNSSTFSQRVRKWFVGNICKTNWDTALLPCWMWHQKGFWIAKLLYVCIFIPTFQQKGGLHFGLPYLGYIWIHSNSLEKLKWRIEKRANLKST